MKTVKILALSACTLLAVTKGQAQLLAPGGIVGVSGGTTQVGVGDVTTPLSNQLVVSDSITNRGLMKLVSSNNLPNDKWWIGFCHGTITTDAYDRARIGVDIQAGGSGRLFFSTGLHSSLNERMRIDENGKVGIGKDPSAFDYHLNVESNITTTGNPGLPNAIRASVNGTTSSFGTGLYAEALYNGHNTGITGFAAGSYTGAINTRNTGVSGTAQYGQTTYGGDFIGRLSDFAYGVRGNARGTQDSYGGDFTASAATTTTAVHAVGDGTQATTTTNYGVKAEATSDHATNYGVYAKGETSASGPSPQQNFGIYTIAKNTAYNLSVNYGIYAVVDKGNAASYAGYFMGDIPDGMFPGGFKNAAFFNGHTYGTGPTTTVSDKKFKENIKKIDNALGVIMQLAPSSYTFKGKNQFPSFNFDSGKQFGFIAQDLEKVIPEIVQEGVNPVQFDSKGNKIADAVSFKGVQYTELIPILVAGMQEQQVLIKTKDAKISELEERIQRLETNKSTGASDIGNSLDGNAMLFQNTPNPFSHNTEIRYRLPLKYTTASILIFDMNGKQLKQILLQDAGEGQVQVSADDLSAGMYLYSLIIDGQEISTKRMILAAN